MRRPACIRIASLLLGLALQAPASAVEWEPRVQLRALGAGCKPLAFTSSADAASLSPHDRKLAQLARILAAPGSAVFIAGTRFDPSTGAFEASLPYGPVVACSAEISHRSGGFGRGRSPSISNVTCYHYVGARQHESKFARVESRGERHSHFCTEGCEAAPFAALHEVGPEEAADPELNRELAALSGCSAPSPPS